MRLPFARAAATLALVSSGAALAPGALAQTPPKAPTAAALEEAKTHMHAGASFYNDPSGHKCEEAYREFKKAYELSGSINALKNMGVCSIELEHDGEAIDELTRYLETKGDQVDPAEKTQVESDLGALKAAVAWVTLGSDRPGVKVTDVRTPARGFPVTNHHSAPIAAKRLGIHPGSHVFTAALEGQPDQVWKVEVPNGGTLEHVFEYDRGKPVVAEGFAAADLHDTPKPPPQSSDSGFRAYYLTGGLTVALAVPTVIFMVSAGNKNTAYKAVNGTEPASELTPLHNGVQSANLLADVFLGLTAASLVTTGVLFFTRSTKAPPKTGLLHGVTVSPATGPALRGAVLSGRF
jgi:hypothetical protein